MKPIYTLVLALTLACSLTRAEDPPVPSVPAALEPLKTQITARHWAFKGPGLILSFRAEQPLTDEQWKAIESLDITRIVTGGNGIDDAAIARLAKRDPEGLVLDGADITDDGCGGLAQMKSLRSLSLGHVPNRKTNPFTGAGLARLKDCPKLEIFSFGGTSTRESAMDAIGEITQLKDFSSWHTQNGDPHNPYLLKLKNLESLTIGNSLKRWDGKPRQLCLTDASLETLAQMKSLQNLTLMQARLTLPALEQLKSLPNLKKLNLDHIDISAADLEKLKAALPAVAITGKPLTDEERKSLDEFLN